MSWTWRICWAAIRCRPTQPCWRAIWRHKWCWSRARVAASAVNSRRQIVLQRPRQLLLLDHNEFGLYTIHQELQAICSGG